MTDLRTAAQQALEALSEVDNCTYINDYGDAALDTAYESGMVYKAIAALRAALAQQDELVQEQDVEDAIEAAYWHFDARKKGLNEWAYAPQSERDAFKAEARKLVRGYFPTRQAQDTKREMLAVADAFIRGKRAALAQQEEPVEPVEPVAWMFTDRESTEFFEQREDWDGWWTPLYTAPPQRQPLTEEEIVDAVREADLDWQKGWTLDETQSNRFVTLARAVERAHGIKE